MARAYSLVEPHPPSTASRIRTIRTATPRARLTKHTIACLISRIARTRLSLAASRAGAAMAISFFLSAHLSRAHMPPAHCLSACMHCATPPHLLQTVADMGRRQKNARTLTPHCAAHCLATRTAFCLHICSPRAFICCSANTPLWRLITSRISHTTAGAGQRAKKKKKNGYVIDAFCAARLCLLSTPLPASTAPYLYRSTQPRHLPPHLSPHHLLWQHGAWRVAHCAARAPGAKHTHAQHCGRKEALKKIIKLTLCSSAYHQPSRRRENTALAFFMCAPVGAASARLRFLCARTALSLHCAHLLHCARAVATYLAASPLPTPLSAYLSYKRTRAIWRENIPRAPSYKENSLAISAHRSACLAPPYITSAPACLTPATSSRLSCGNSAPYLMNAAEWDAFAGYVPAHTQVLHTRALSSPSHLTLSLPYVTGMRTGLVKL